MMMLRTWRRSLPIAILLIFCLFQLLNHQYLQSKLDVNRKYFLKPEQEFEVTPCDLNLSVIIEDTSRGSEVIIIEDNSRKEELKPITEKPKEILIWSSYANDASKSSDWNSVFARQLEGKCPHKCTITYNQEKWRDADAILFKQFDKSPLPIEHPQNQPWVLFSVEAPTYKTWVIPKKQRSIYDWVMTYHRDADVVMPFGYITPSNRSIDYSMVGPNRDYWSMKSTNRFAAWMVSHCRTSSRRETFVQEFQRYEKVDIYGKCGSLKCGERMILRNVAKTKSNKSEENECYRLMSSYLFYFAFENSICKDYITEKFFKALQLDAITVVLGGGDYRSLAPPNSYIDALDFNTTQDLAKYLRQVAENRTLYNSYFEWKSKYKVEVGFPFSPLICDLCTKLHNGSCQFSKELSQFSQKRKTEHIKKDVSDWFTSVSKCRRWSSSSITEPN